MKPVSIEIRSYKGWLILKLVSTTPKLKIVGNGTSLINFNRNDVHISPQALSILNSNIGCNLKEPYPALEVLSENTLWWASIDNGIIIPNNTVMHIHVLPVHTQCDNNIDDKIKEIINNNTK